MYLVCSPEQIHFCRKNRCMSFHSLPHTLPPLTMGHPMKPIVCKVNAEEGQEPCPDRVPRKLYQLKCPIHPGVGDHLDCSRAHLGQHQDGAGRQRVHAVIDTGQWLVLQGSYHGLQYDEQKEIGHRLCMHVYVRGEGLGG